MSDIKKEELAYRIKEIRVSRKETLEEFAEQIKKKTDFKIKTTKSNVSKWEKGLNIPNDITLKAISELGGVSIFYLLYGKKTISDLKKLGRSSEDYLHIAESENKEYLINTFDGFNIEKILKLSREQDRLLATTFRNTFNSKDFHLLDLMANVTDSAFFVKQVTESDEYDDEEFDYQFNIQYQNSIEELTDYLRNLNNE